LFQRLQDLLAEIARRFVIFFSGKELFRVQTGKTALNVELGKLRHPRQGNKHSGREEPSLAEKPGHRHIAELPALRHLLHGGLHLLLRLGQTFERVTLGWHGSSRVELAETSGLPMKRSRMFCIIFGSGRKELE
jgi:hypothetical protein